MPLAMIRLIIYSENNLPYTKYLTALSAWAAVVLYLLQV